MRVDCVQIMCVRGCGKRAAHAFRYNLRNYSAGLVLCGKLPRENSVSKPPNRTVLRSDAAQVSENAVKLSVKRVLYDRL